MSELEKAALNFARYTEAKKEFDVVLGNTIISESDLLQRRIQHSKDLQEEIDEAYQIMLKYLAEQKAQTNKALTEIVRISEEAGLYDN